MPDFEDARVQITTYATQLYPKYTRLAEFLHHELCQLVSEAAPHAIVQTRAKSVSSFSEKLFRKPYHNPCGEFTDLCGGRVIAHTIDKVDAVVTLLKKRFIIDAENSVDHTHRLKAKEFGYRSIHYIIKFTPDDFGHDYEDLYDLMKPRAEIQVRTLLEHAWADISYGYAYKPGFTMPLQLERETSCVAALLEGADDMFLRIRSSLHQHAINYGAYMSPNQMRRNIQILEFALATEAGTDAENAELAMKIGRLAMGLDERDWENAIDIISKTLERISIPRNAEMLLWLGTLKCKLHRGQPASPEYLAGQHHLHDFIKHSPRNVDGLLSLANTYRGQSDAIARQYYNSAFLIDPTNPLVLNNYLELEISHRRDISIVRYLRPTIDKAIQHSHNHIGANFNLPWAYYNIGFFYLLLDESRLSLTAYSKAARLSGAAYMITTAIDSVKRLGFLADQLPCYQFALELLELCSTAKFGHVLQTHPEQEPIKSPVIIITGPNSQLDAGLEQRYEKLINPFLEDFSGTIICDGTSGISGLVSELKKQHLTQCDRIKMICYSPLHMPKGPIIYNNYETRSVRCAELSPLQPIRKWSDIIKSGILPENVKVLGLGGDSIADLDHQIALTFGAWVGVIQNCEGKAEETLRDEDPERAKTLLSLPSDPLAIHAFVVPNCGGPG